MCMAADVEVRCPVGPRRLFMRMRQQGEHPVYIQPENWIEVSCYDCRREMRQHGRDVQRVLHRFDFSGELMETLVVE
jgi:hypothetical protein